MMRLSLRFLAPIVLACALLAAPSPVLAAEGGVKVGEIAAEVPIRILATVRLLAGSVVFVPSAAFAAVPSAIDRTWSPLQETFQLHVGDPWEYLVERPIGEDIGGV